MSPDASRISPAKPEKPKPVPPNLTEELHGYYYEDLEEGMSATFSRTVSEADIAKFAGISGDTNPVHLSEDFAKETMFGGRIAHGMLSAGYISTLIGTKLPGPGCIYVSQSLRFKGPVRSGDTVNTRATITGFDDEKGRVTLWCECFVGDVVILEGEAVVQVPRRNPA